MTTAYAPALPGSVAFDPPIPPDDFSVKLPECPACGGGTVILYVCGGCGTTEVAGTAYCCSQPMLIRGAYVSALAGNHSWQGCSITDGRRAL